MTGALFYEFLISFFFRVATSWKDRCTPRESRAPSAPPTTSATTGSASSRSCRNKRWPSNQIFNKIVIKLINQSIQLCEICTLFLLLDMCTYRIWITNIIFSKLWILFIWKFENFIILKYLFYYIPRYFNISSSPFFLLLCYSFYFILFYCFIFTSCSSILSYSLRYYKVWGPLKFSALPMNFQGWIHSTPDITTYKLCMLKTNFTNKIKPNIYKTVLQIKKLKNLFSEIRFYKGIRCSFYL